MLTVVALLGAAGCGSGEDAVNEVSGAVGPPARSDVLTERIVARGAHLSAGDNGVRLLRIPRIGRLLVTCDREGATSTAIVAGRRTATTDVVAETGTSVVDGYVNPGERFVLQEDPFAAGIQRAQMSAFAKAQVPIATLWVAARRIDEEPRLTCAISAQAVVFQSTAGTITGP